MLVQWECQIFVHYVNKYFDKSILWWFKIYIFLCVSIKINLGDVEFWALKFFSPLIYRMKNFYNYFSRLNFQSRSIRVWQCVARGRIRISSVLIQRWCDRMSKFRQVGKRVSGVFWWFKCESIKPLNKERKCSFDDYQSWSKHQTSWKSHLVYI